MVVYQNNNARLLVYTRKAQEGSYPPGLAGSIHFAVSRDGIHYAPLHKNYGILFAEGEISDDNTIVPKGVKEPFVFPMGEGEYGIAAVRVNEDGSCDELSQGKLLTWKTSDFINFHCLGLVDKESIDREYVSEECTEIYGEQVNGSAIEIAAGLCDQICQRWDQLRQVAVILPESVTIKSEQELNDTRAVAVYSDGSTALKRVEWQKEQVDFTASGSYQVNGKIYDRKYSFPLAKGYGDPVIFQWDGKWHFLGTNDNLGDIGLYVREADTIEGLFEENAVEHLILGVDEEKGFVQTFWAPEFHIIGGRPYILFAVGGKVWGPQCYLMKLKNGGRIIEADGWETPVKVLRQNGRPLAEDGITLDMTYLLAGGHSYMVWSYRQYIGTPKDTGSMLYIARVNEEKPWQLTGEPVLLSRPLFGWENVNGTINNEGPHGFVHNGKVYLAYSGGDACGYTYAVGLLTADETRDLTDIAVWEKSGTPILSFYSVEGVYGPGHNSFFVDDNGNLMIAYHGETSIESRLRCDGIHRVHFNIHGEPVFDMSAERDLDPALCAVSMQIILQ